jgi:hypothetical protein
MVPRCSGLSAEENRHFDEPEVRGDETTWFANADQAELPEGTALQLLIPTLRCRGAYRTSPFESHPLRAFRDPFRAFRPD